MSILQTTALIAGGSAVVGAGAAAGRDVYQGMKRNIGLILLLILIGSALYGSWWAGIWWGRNYRSWYGGMLMRLVALLTLGSCWLAVIIVGHIIVPGLLVSTPIAMWNWEVVDHFTTFDTAGGIVTLSLAGLAGLGVLAGLASRTDRRQKWEAAAHNAWFLQTYGLQEIQEDRLRDLDDQGYRLENVLPGELEFMALGQSGMRAYLTFDESGKYTSWSGVVPQR